MASEPVARRRLAGYVKIKRGHMIRFLFRFVGLWLLAGAFVAFVIDGMRSVASSRIVLTSTGEAWSVIHRPSLEWFRAYIEGNLPAWAWDPVAINFLLTPLWAVLGVIGILFALLGRTPARPIGYSSRD
jgi:hypothetical protein